ncbi:pollen-specific leucine-rich repeat extensin-like protein 3 [Drosophila eugracilis]|uniref:pollen-specific leucine-rich repeat extensin-like protein 3 n=1 Tax=Drosophila eugracilis TaxID=29029 RepID=UPI0007E5F463|nr:pollen-specific leucine-rich repeat extensin-like protein 3 [Drosophila eugracilis]
MWQLTWAFALAFVLVGADAKPSQLFNHHFNHFDPHHLNHFDGHHLNHLESLHALPHHLDYAVQESVLPPPATLLPAAAPPPVFAPPSPIYGPAAPVYGPAPPAPVFAQPAPVFAPAPLLPAQAPLLPAPAPLLPAPAPLLPAPAPLLPAPAPLLPAPAPLLPAPAPLLPAPQFLPEFHVPSVTHQVLPPLLEAIPFAPTYRAIPGPKTTTHRVSIGYAFPKLLAAPHAHLKALPLKLAHHRHHSLW